MEEIQSLDILGKYPKVIKMGLRIWGQDPYIMAKK
jgi:hypothetical protein